MSDIIPLNDGSPSNLPSYIKEASIDSTNALIGGEDNSYKRISIKGNVFRLMDGGQEVAANDDRAMNVVIVDVAPKTSRIFYGDAYKDGEMKKPSCFSDDGIEPDSYAEEPQAATCAACPQNVSTKEKGANCRYQHKIAVVLQDNLEGDVYAMNIPAKSLFGKAQGSSKLGMPLKAYGKYLAAGKLPIEAVVTEMRFDSNSPVPKLLFKAVGILPEEKFASIMKRKEEADTMRAVGKVKDKSEGSPAPVKVSKPVVENKDVKLEDVLDEFDK